MRRRSLRALLAVAIGGIALVATACVPPAAPGAPPLLVGDWVTGRAKIWDLAFAPGWIPPIYTENNTGAIYARMSDAEPARVLGTVSQFDPTFANSGEGGLNGIAFSPGYDGVNDRRVFTCYTTSTANKVVRFDLDFLAPPEARITNWTVIVDNLPRHHAWHNGCRVRFQPGTGALFVTTGDAFIATEPQSTTSMGGKVLRIDQNGAPWPGNVSGSLWYTRGHRNPQGIAFRPGSNDPYSVEHGTDTNDEVNRLVNGANAGYNPNDGAGNYDQSKPMTDFLLEPGNTMAPLWASGSPTVAPSGGTFLSGPQWKIWDGALVVACLDGEPDVGQRLLVMRLNADGTALVEPPTSLLDRGVRLRAAVQGPDGNLYVITDGDNGTGAIWKVAPV
jgi:glucose/arabinose dehydrogenase